MDNISLEGKTNFFEKRVGEYQKSGVMSRTGTATNQASDFDISVDFWSLISTVNSVELKTYYRQLPYVLSSYVSTAL